MAAEPSSIQEITVHFGQPVIDLFATKSNTQVGRFFSRTMGEGAEAVDAFQTSWPEGLLCMFPLFSVLQLTLRRIRDQGSRVLLIAPWWPRHNKDGRMSRLDPTSKTSSTTSGSPDAYAARSIQADHMAAERQGLSVCRYPSRLLSTFFHPEDLPLIEFHVEEVLVLI